MPKNERYQLDVPYEPGRSEIKIQLQDLQPWEVLEDVCISLPAGDCVPVTSCGSSSIGIASSEPPALYMPADKTLRFDRVASDFSSSQQTVRITGRVTQMSLSEYMKRFESTEDE